MKQHFWREKWQAQQIGFHRDEVNDALATHAAGLFTPGGQILVPLCGMTLDMDWLLQKVCCDWRRFVPEAVTD